MLLAETLAATDLSGNVIVSLGGLALLFAIAASWATLREVVKANSRQLEELEKWRIAMESRAGELERWRAFVQGRESRQDTSPMNVWPHRAERAD